MATAWWWLSPPLPAWLGSEAVLFLALNAVVAAVAILSARARPSSLSTPRRGGAAGITRRASSAVLQSVLSFSFFSFPSACLSYLQPDAAAFAYQETEHPVRSPTNTNTKPSPRALAPTPTPPPPAPAAGEEGDDDEEEEGDPSAMSMDEAYALVLASRQRPEPEQEEEARRSEVDARAEEFIRGFNEELRQQRLKSIFNYTQMLKQRGLAAGRRQPEADARPDQL
ncbi:unnamed protein product [Urochloa decumbens]|uniref:Uncharacterized protein n=1 Tax=Urochloa decumbens TaxID=240449 RepID=A0ABC9FS02_9POAL